MKAPNRVPVLLSLGVLFGAAVPSGAHAAVDHRAWDDLLRRHVHEGFMDYQGIAQERQALKEYLGRLAEAHVEPLPSPAHQLAFWINAYNATVVDGVLERYPLSSIRQVSGFFKSHRHPVGGERLTLDEMEARGRTVGDFRIHFALVCASSSCPPLRAEAYAPDRLEAQLAEQARAFLHDPQRGLRLQGQTVWASKMFQWYPADFIPPEERGVLPRLTAKRLLNVLEPYLDDATKASIHDRRFGLKFLPYDWALNAWVEPKEMR